MEDDLGVINMQGRIYDPRIGRFLQADPLVAAGGSQGPNRYSYVRNNPLNYFDPSGYFDRMVDLESSYVPTCHYAESANDPSINGMHESFENYNDAAYEVNGTIYDTFAEAVGAAALAGAAPAEAEAAALQTGQRLFASQLFGLANNGAPCIAEASRQRLRRDPCVTC